MEAKIEQLARESIEAFNRDDWTAIRELTGPGYVYEETGTNRRFEGEDDMIRALQEWKTAFADATGEVVGIVVDGDTSVVDLVWRGTQTGPLATGAGELPPSHRPFEVRACMWQRWSGGKLVSERHHIDVLTMLGQLGALPATP